MFPRDDRPAAIFRSLRGGSLKLAFYKHHVPTGRLRGGVEASSATSSYDLTRAGDRMAADNHQLPSFR